MTTDYKLKRNGTVAVDTKNEWRPMTECPRGALVQLLGRGGVATHGTYDGKSNFWLGWCPMPAKPAWLKEMMS